MPVRQSQRGCSDEELMVRYCDGDPEAFEQLFGRYQARAYGFFLRRTGSEERSEDLYQELFLRIHRARFDYDPARRFSPWLFQIARNLLVDELRKALARPEALLGDEVEQVEATGAEVDTRVAARELVGAALAQLGDTEERVLLGSKLEGRSYAELAQEIGRSVAATKKLASRAMQRLRVAVEEDHRLASPSS